MKLSRKISIDRFWGRLVCCLLIPLTRILGITLRRDHSIRQENVRTILVAKFMGKGSIVHAMPMLRALKNKYPSAQIIFLTHKANQSLFQHIVDVDEVLYIDDCSLYHLAVSNLATIWAMARRRIDLYFDLELFSIYGALMSLFSLARNRFGFFCSKETDYKAYLFTHLMYFNFQMPIRICYLQLARMAHISKNASGDLVPLHIGPELSEAAKFKLDAVLGKTRGNRVLAFNVNASDLALERRWPGEYFAEVARHFARRGYSILFVGSPEERAYVQSVVDLIGNGEDIGGRVHNVAGAFGFSEFLAVLQATDGVLTNDTGIMNFSYALGQATLSLFGPCSSTMYHVEAENTRFLEKQVYCRPCIHHLIVPPCRGDNVCMVLIHPEEVIAALEGLMDSKFIPGNGPSHLRFLSKNGAPLGVLRTRGALNTD